MNNKHLFTIILTVLSLGIQDVHSQTTLIDINQRTHHVDSIWMNPKNIYCFNLDMNQRMEYPKKHIRKIINGNDTISFSQVSKAPSSTFGQLDIINYANGSLETGIVDRTTLDSTYFRLYGDYPIISIENNKIDFINYGDGLIEVYSYGTINNQNSNFIEMTKNIYKNSVSSSTSYWGFMIGFTQTHNTAAKNQLKTPAYNGYNFGLNWTMFIAKKNAVVINIQYIKKGINLGDNDSSSSNNSFENSTNKIEYHLLEIPILYQYKIPIKKCYIDLESGFYMNFKLKEKYNGFTPIHTPVGHNLDIGIPFSIGFYLPYQKNYIHFALRYTLGFIKGTKSDYGILGSGSEDSFGALNSFSINISYLFKTKKQTSINSIK